MPQARVTIHYRSPGAHRVACSARGGLNTNFTLDVTCAKCVLTSVYKQAHAEFMTVVDSWSAPKEDQLSKLGHPERTTQ